MSDNKLFILNVVLIAGLLALGTWAQQDGAAAVLPVRQNEAAAVAPSAPASATQAAVASATSTAPLLPKPVIRRSFWDELGGDDD